MNKKTLCLVESALMIAVATVLNEFVKVGRIWALGGGITIASMLPLIFISFRHGTKWGVFTAFIFSLLQLALGMKNVQYGQNAMQVLGIILLDYVVAYTMVGLAGMYKDVFGKDKRIAGILLGTVVAMLLRFVCHYLSGVLIWEALWPNEHGYTSHAWSFLYNGSYMFPEMGITALLAAISYKPLKKYWDGERQLAK